MSLNETPRGERIHIGLYGRRNTGKSSLVNAISGYEMAIVSEIAGTTTDPVLKSIEIHGLGPCVLIDTAGIDDAGTMGNLRVEKTRLMLDKTDIAILVLSAGDLASDKALPEKKMLEKKLPEKTLAEDFRRRKIPYLTVLNKADLLNNEDKKLLTEQVEKEFGVTPLLLSAQTKEGMDELWHKLIQLVPEDWEDHSITGKLVKDGDTVLLVMPQDIQAPKGRLILPQVQVLRELLDKKCVTVSTTTDKLDAALAALVKAPQLIITDSQVFDTVWQKKPAESMLSSFSVLLAGYKGDILAFVKGCKSLDSLTEDSRVLIAEACTHAPLAEDIGREKIPALLKKKYGQGLQVDIVSGSDFPSNLSSYNIIIHCGACMFSRKYMLSRLEKAVSAGVPMTNYGIVMAYMAGILDKIDFP